MPKTPLNSHKPGKEPKGKKCPPLEEAAAFYIENEADKMRALDFTKWLRDNKLSPIAGNNGYNWHIRFKYRQGDKLGTYNGCYIKMFYDTWHVLPSKDILEQILLREELKESIWSNSFSCYGCNWGCYEREQNIKHRHEYIEKGICLKEPICFSSPDEKILDILKEILLARKNSDDLKVENIYTYGMI